MDYYKNKDYVYKKRVKELNLDLVRPPRAGVILYTKVNDEYFFALGVDTMSGEYTDFGGGISYKENADKNVILGALRELNEEALGIFGHIDYKQVINSLALYNNFNLIIFKYIDDPMIDVVSAFRIQYNINVAKYPTIIPEVSNIKWFSHAEFRNIIMKRGMLFHRIQNFLQKAGNFYWLLE
jgi:hypothetical protein